MSAVGCDGWITDLHAIRALDRWHGRLGSHALIKQKHYFKVDDFAEVPPLQGMVQNRYCTLPQTRWAV